MPQNSHSKMIDHLELYCEWSFHFRFFLKLDEASRVYKFCTSFRNPELRFQVQQMSTAHQGIKVNALAAKIGATLGLESTHHYECQLQSAGRRKGEQVGLWAFRLSELYNHSLPAKDFYLFVHTDLYRQQLFNLFCRGIDNKYLVYYL